MEKKKGIVLGILVIVVVLFAFFTTNVEEKKEKANKSAYTPEEIMKKAQRESYNIPSNERVKLKSINIDEYLKIYHDDEKSLVFVGSSSCPYCSIARPIIENFAYKYRLTIYYLNTAKFEDDDESKFIKSDDYFEEGFGVPMLLYVGNKKIIDIADGLFDTEHYLEFFKENDLVRE